MTRARSQAYRSSAMSDLARQMLYAPQETRAQVVRRAERFHDELEEAKNYPIDFVVYRLTDRRVPPGESVMLVGEALRPDLRLLIDAVSRSIEMLADEGDPCETTAELAQRLGVSTKTVSRWRSHGLRWRWGVQEQGGKKGVLFPRSAVQAYRARAGARVASAGVFARMDGAEKGRLIARARRLATATDRPAQAVIDHLARRTRRSSEALRLLFKKHDEQQPDQRIFADRTGPLTGDQKRAIAQAYAQGQTVAALCMRYGKSRSTVYRAIHELRAAAALQIPVRYVGSPTFERADADEVLLRPVERGGKLRLPERGAIKSLPAALRGVYDHPMDPDEATRVLIVRYNFLKHRAAQVQQALSGQSPRAVDVKRFERLMERAAQARAEAMAGTLPVVLSVVRRQQSAGHQGAGPDLLAMLDAGNAVLIQELERFDVARSHTFASVLTNRTLQALARLSSFWQPVDEAALLQRLAEAGFVVE